MILKEKMPKGVKFAMLPEAAILDQRLAPMDLRVLAYLLCRTFNWKVYVKQVAQVLEVSDRTVRRSIERLEEAGYATRLVERGFGRVSYPDIVIKAIPTGQPRPATPASDLPTEVGSGKRVQESGLVCPDEPTPLPTGADKVVHQTADSDDRLTQKEFSTQKEITQTQPTQTEDTQQRFSEEDKPRATTSNVLAERDSGGITWDDLTDEEADKILNSLPGIRYLEEQERAERVKRMKPGEVDEFGYTKEMHEEAEREVAELSKIFRPYRG